MSNASNPYAKNVEYSYPTYYGSHTKMVDKKATEDILDAEKYVVLTDEHGKYVTERDNVDSGMADPYRNATPEWRENFLKEQMK